MKTKLVLMAMALPALFAACTSDEFVEPAQGNFNGRALLDGLTVNVDQDANTRFAWGNYQWKFEAGDQFGAALTDPTAGTVQNGQLLGNYIFSQAANGSYSTTSQMYEGIYFFYSYPDFQGKATRDLVKFDLGVQKADLTKPEEVISNTQLFFSPLYDIKAKTVSTALPLKFYPYWSVAAFKIKNNTGAAFKISQIVLNGSGFITKGEIDATKIRDAKLKYSIAEGDDKYSLPEDMTDEKYAVAMATANIAKATTAPDPANSIALNCGNYELADGAEVVAYMSVPASVISEPAEATDTKVSGVEIIVNVGGVSKAIKVVEPDQGNNPGDIASTGIGGLKFERGKTKPVFGVETDGNLKALVVAKANLQSAAGFYVDNKADLLDVINANRGGIDIYNMGDLAIDKDVANALNLYSAAGVTFANPIDVKVSGDATISNTTFKGGVTVKSGNVTFGVKTVLSAGKTMTVEGGKAILNDGTYNESGSSVIVNGGELVVAKTDAAIAAITVNGGALTLNGESQTIGSSKIAALTFGKDKDTKLNVSLSRTEDNTQPTLTVGESVTLVSKTTTTVAAGNVVSISSGKTLTNNGTIVNKGEISGDGTLLNTNDIETEGKISANGVNNTGYIKLTNEWTSDVKTTVGNGLIDNTVGGIVSNSGSTVFRVYTGEVTRVSAETAAGELVVFNNVTLTGGVDLSSSNLSNSLLLLGTTDIEANLTMSSNATLYIGFDATTPQHIQLAKKLVGIDADKVVDYNKTIVTSVYGSATISKPILINNGGTSRNKGTIQCKNTGTKKGIWIPEGSFTMQD